MNAPTYPVYDGIARGSRILAARIAARALCPHCGIAPADSDGLACAYCRGYAHRPSPVPNITTERKVI